MPATTASPSSCPACGRPYPRKGLPRTTGPGSQSAHLHGHLQQIAEHTGFSMSEVKAALKDDLMDWPHVERFGHMVPVSEADVDTMVESAAIEWSHVQAAGLGIVLREA